MDERAVLTEYLHSHGQKMTESRSTVLDAFLTLEHHVTADELLAAARRIDSRIGQATVFRTIKVLEEAGIARAAVPDDGARRYEHAYRRNHHDHLVCLDCGIVIEFFEPEIEKVQETVYRLYGFTPTAHSLELKGYCPACTRLRTGTER